MLHIYRIYKYVKLVDEENEKLAETKLLELKNGNKAARLQLVNEVMAMGLFGEKRVWFKKMGIIRASQISMAALKLGYLEPTEKDEPDKDRHLRVTHLKGLPLIDGFFLFRPGLWKAWHEEHGWIATAAFSTAILTAAIYLGKQAWHFLLAVKP